MERTDDGGGENTRAERGPPSAVTRGHWRRENVQGSAMTEAGRIGVFRVDDDQPPREGIGGGKQKGAHG